jgi:hypothetical protein
MTLKGGDLSANSPHFPCRLPTISTTDSQDAFCMTTDGKHDNGQRV